VWHQRQGFDFVNGGEPDGRAREAEETAAGLLIVASIDGNSKPVPHAALTSSRNFENCCESATSRFRRWIGATRSYNERRKHERDENHCHRIG
jgi:hypothetical protein